MENCLTHHWTRPSFRMTTGRSIRASITSAEPLFSVPEPLARADEAGSRDYTSFILWMKYHASVSQLGCLVFILDTDEFHKLRPFFDSKHSTNCLKKKNPEKKFRSRKKTPQKRRTSKPSLVCARLKTRFSNK